MSNFTYVVSTLVRRGPRFLIRYAQESLAFDIIHGTNTHLRTPKSDSLASNAERRDGVLYVASFTSVVRKTLQVARSLVGDQVYRESQFVDLGCGKGKALLVHALDHGREAQHPALGIEYDEGLCEIARSNVAKLRLEGHAPEVHCDSALNAPRYIRGKHLIVYLYNPFGGDTLRAVLKSLSGYPHVLIYVDPVERDVLEGFGYTIMDSHEGRLHADTWLVARQPGTTAEI